MWIAGFSAQTPTINSCNLGASDITPGHCISLIMTSAVFKRVVEVAQDARKRHSSPPMYDSAEPKPLRVNAAFKIKNWGKPRQKYAAKTIV